MSIKSTKYIPPSLRKKDIKKELKDFNDLKQFPQLCDAKMTTTTMNYKQSVETVNQEPNELPDGWIRLSTYKPEPKKPIEYPDMTPAEEFIKIMEICSRNRENFYRSRMIEPPYVYVSPPEYEDVIVSDTESDDLDMDDPEYEKIMNKFERK